MARFLSKCPNQVLCMVPNRIQIVDGITVPVAGRHIRFDHGEYETSDRKEINFIRAHRLFGVAITEAEQVNDKTKPELQENDQGEGEGAE